MNRISTLFAMLALAASGAQAQWKPDDHAFTVIGQDGVYGQCNMKTARTASGETVLTWLNTPKDTRYDNPKYGYYLYMQVFDANGNPKFGKDGKLIIDKATMSYVTDYGMQLSPDDNILLSYTDTRNDANKKCSENYMYCYTTDGTPVWDKEGIKIQSVTSRPKYKDIVPTICVSGDNIYGVIDHVEYYKVKADETNWEPSPWNPDEEMPDSIDKQESDYQIMRYNADGTQVWKSPLRLYTSDVWTYPAPDGGIYLLYVNSGSGFSARRIDSNGNDVWHEPVVVESGCVSNDIFTTPPTVVADGKGGLYLVYGKLLSFSAYQVANRLTPDGQVYDDEFIINGTQDGNARYAVAAVNGDRTFVAFSYEDVTTQQNLWVNQLDINGDYTLDGDSLLGYSLDNNEMWGLTPVKAVPQNDGWVVLYGNGQSWNGANFYVSKIGFDGKEIWRKQIAEDDFKSSGFSIESDDNNAYIFYTCDKEIGIDGKETPGEGGLRVMCVDITEGTTGIKRINDVDSDNGREVYNAEGVRVGDISNPGLYIVKENGVTRKIVKK